VGVLTLLYARVIWEKFNDHRADLLFKLRIAVAVLKDLPPRSGRPISQYQVGFQPAQLLKNIFSGPAP